MTKKRRPRYLPEYVTRFKDRHGKWRLRYRRKGYPSTYLHAPLGTEEFRAEYRACESAAPSAVSRSVPGTIDDLVIQYCAVPSRLGPGKVTQAKVRNILERFRQEHGHRQVADVEFEHIDAIIATKMKKVQVGKRMEGGVEAARKLRKELRRLFAFAKRKRLRSDNPVDDAELVKTPPDQRSTGFYTWTEEDIDQFRRSHALGTRARLALELLLWTGQRRGDAIRMGREDIVNGRIQVTQAKGGKHLWIPVASQLLEAITAMPATNHDCFLLTESGEPFSNAGFGNWFRDQCDEAALPKCTAHGLRKAIMRRMAELDMGNQTLKSISGHSRDDEVALYTAGANQVRMADTAMERLSQWETADRREP